MSRKKLIKNKISLLLIYTSFFFLLSFFFFTSASASTYFVSTTDGNDTCTGLSQTPYTTGQTACPIKTLTKLNTKTFSPGDNIDFKSGDTFYGTITISQSGTAGNPITFSSYGSGNKPIITGFTTITGWTNEGGGIYSKVITAESAPQMVTIDNTQYAMGRWPNTGWRTMTGVSGGTQITDFSLTGTPNWTGAEVVIRKNHWIIDRHPITNQSGSTLTFTSTSAYDPVVNWGYFIQNNLQTLDQYGEWYYNPTSKKISIYSTSTPTNVKVASIDTLATVYQHDYVTFDNLALEGANVAALFLRNSNYIKVQNCNIDFSGTDAISGLYGLNVENSDYMTIENNTINHSNNNGISLSWTYFPHATIRNNTIQNTGMIAGMGGDGDGKYNAIQAIGPNSMIEFNRIDNTGYIPIIFGGDNTIVRNNFITNFCLVKDDCAAIYTYRNSMSDPMNFNRSVLNNILINGPGAPAGTDSNKGAASGIYMDGFTTGVKIANNSVSGCSYGGVFINSNENGIVVDNILYNNTNQISINVSGPYYSQHNNLSISRNIFFAAEPSQLALQYYNVGGNISPTILSNNNYFLRPFDDTYFISTTQSTGGIGYTLASWQDGFGLDLSSKKSPVEISPYIINSIIGSNKFSNGSFTSNANGVNCWNDVGNCSLSWNNNKLDGGTLQASFDSQTPTANSLLSIQVGAVSSGKNYVLKYSFLGSTNNNTFNIYLRKSGPPWNYLTPVSYTQISTTRSENEIVFTSPITDPNAVIVFEISTKNSTNNTMWFDNINLSEADVTIANPDDYFLFDYNATTQNKTVSLPWPVVDLDGVKHTGDITIDPYRSVIYLKDPNPTVSDTTKPLISFSIPPTSTSLSVSITTLSATDTVGVTGYLLNETGTIPSPASGTWSSTPQPSYTFTSAGNKTLYAWAKDASGKVSASVSGSVVITLLATTFTFTGSTTGNVNTASSNFTLTPNNTYTGTITITPSGTGSTGLSSITKTFSSSSVAQTFTITPTVAGSITLTATNSGSLTNPSSKIYIVNAIIDSTKPLISSFTIPTTSTTLSVSVTLSATDATGVTGYLLNETGITPNPASGPWSSTPQTSYPFTSAGTKTLYAFAKDTAGNISLPTSQSITITLPVVNNNTGGGGGGGSYTQPVTTTPTIPIPTIPTIDTGCTLGNLFSITTGKPCSTTNISTTSLGLKPIPTIPTIDTGCTLGNLFSITTGKPCSTTNISTTSLGLTRTLKLTIPRTTGDDVKALQIYLNNHSYNCGIPDGVFGTKTRLSVISFQKAHNLKPDGAVGMMTRGEMKN